jgi:hypothetical protein
MAQAYPGSRPWLYCRPMPTSAAVVKRKRQAKKARARQRARYDVRSQYRQGDVPVQNIGVLTIEDPYAQAGRIDSEGNLRIDARLEPYQHADGTTAEGAPAWSPPRRPLMTVFRALKDDPVGRMHSRRQIDEAQFQAARAFQEAADRATLGAVRTLDWTKTPVSGGIAPDPLPEGRQKAMKWLRVAEEAVVRRHGTEGLGLTRAVLCDRQSVEQTARLRGADSDREVWFWARLFRRCLDCLALAFGFSTSTRRPPRLNGHGEPDDPAEDPGRQASEAELADPRLRSGRANGHG